jgi:CubicO group peptidase (beta-lactamase class C family)
MGLGYALGGPLADALGTGTVFGWSGVGGSHASADIATGTAFALTKNRFTITESSTDANVAAIVATVVTDH